MDDELAQHGRTLVGKATVPQNQAAEVLELVNREI